MIVRPLRGKARTAYRHSTAAINILEGSVRSGKTIGSLVDWVEFVRTGPAGNLLMAGRTERTLINNLLLPLQEIYGADRIIINTGSGTVSICGRSVLLIGANNEQARTKIQGLTLAGAYVDEAATVPESFWNMLVSRMSVEGARIWATCNPEGPRHWIKKKWLDRAKLWVDGDGKFHDRRALFRRLPPGHDDRPLNLHRFTFTLDDNAHNLPAEYIANIKASYSGMFYLRMVLGRWALADGVIYHAFDRPKHVIAHGELPKMARVIALGIDYGTTNPTAGILLGIGVDNRLYALDEWAPERGTDAELSRSLADWLTKGKHSPEWSYVDPAAASFKLQLYRDDTVRAADAINGVVDGVRTVASLFSSLQLFVSDRCERLLNEIPGYVWDPSASEKGEDKPVKADDHFCDALRYAVVSSQQVWLPVLPIPIATAATAEEAA
ncbi:PBSX family phage terminase large subunit [Nocardia bovistercoris]|uniref:PBSX family phage terminase large subunit n=1 Tax=Nocardia bovistercoris TaxID=2785916 RepID=A0A931IBY3_9NOCA|nr:PBSX family phage terminase large subunit [Nocardia bovistercoris]MBH0778812.1 PBSX family phage terminase large subunit [Nocardia bovistercoris]